MVTPYQKEQIESLDVVIRHLSGFSEFEKTNLRSLVEDYLSFRKSVAAFLSRHFRSVCSRKCFQHRVSACCSRDGILTFFADLVINALASDAAALERLHLVLERPHTGYKCVYLGKDGCLWRVKPIVCEMFLCDTAKEKVFAAKPAERNRWEAFVAKKKRFTWPDRVVLFDTLEKIFIEAGYQTALMYLNNSPGLLRVKQMTAEKGDRHPTKSI